MFSENLLSTLVTVNNFFHDLAVAFLFASMFLTWWLARKGEISPTSQKSLSRWSLVSLTWVIIGGIIRTLTYQRYYEWVADGGERQIPVLVLKHILLVVLVVAGLYFQFRLGRKGKKSDET